jgi:hypothetical protein
MNEAQDKALAELRRLRLTLCAILTEIAPLEIAAALAQQRGHTAVADLHRARVDGILLKHEGLIEDTEAKKYVCRSLGLVNVYTQESAGLPALRERIKVAKERAAAFVKLLTAPPAPEAGNDRTT